MIQSARETIPPALRPAETWKPFLDGMDEYFTELRARIGRMRFARRPDFTPFPEALAQALGLELAASRRELRENLRDAALRFRMPLSFGLVWKPRIDRVTGGNARISHDPRLADDFVLGQSLLGDISRLGTVASTEPVSGRLAPDQYGMVQIDLGATVTAAMRTELDRILKPLTETAFDYLLGEMRNQDGTDYFHTLWKLD